MPNLNIKIVEANPSTFDAEDTNDPRFSIHGDLVDGYLRFDVVAETIAGERGTIRGFEFFDAMMAHFGDTVTAIEGDWSDLIPELTGNLDRFNEQTAAGSPQQQAALETWTGRMAVRHGFTSIEIKHALPPDAEGSYREVLVQFRKP